MSPGNPNHPVVQEVSEQWYKLCAILMHKMGLTTVELTPADIEAFMLSGRANIAVLSGDKAITLMLVSDAEGARLAKKEGGLPV